MVAASALPHVQTTSAKLRCADRQENQGTKVDDKPLVRNVLLFYSNFARCVGERGQSPSPNSSRGSDHMKSLTVIRGKTKASGSSTSARNAPQSAVSTRRSRALSPREGGGEARLSALQGQARRHSLVRHSGSCHPRRLAAGEGRGPLLPPSSPPAKPCPPSTSTGDLSGGRSGTGHWPHLRVQGPADAGPLSMAGNPVQDQASCKFGVPKKAKGQIRLR